ncbi:MAG: hypothetical protein MUF40_07125, partial [Gemmatimonadaceae bacterium]|nr:hypothetical protein [Gemmatimonadaceae bacterium]
RRLAADAQRVAADGHARMGSVALAESLIVQAMATARDGGHAMQEAEILRTRAEMAWRRGDMATARREGYRAREQFTALGARGDAQRLDAWLDTFD